MFKKAFFSAQNECSKSCWESAFGKNTYDSKKAEELRLTENKKYVQPLTVKLSVSKNPVEIGDVIKIEAEANEGTGGYSYKWSGCVKDVKDSVATVSFTDQCKSCTVSVNVVDQDGNSASDSLTIQCSSIKVKLTKESPKENRIAIGGSASFVAEVYSGEKLFSESNLKYLWERNPDVVFGDPKNPQYEQRGGSRTKNNAIFTKIGINPVWVVVQRQIDGVWRTIGESDQIQIEVVQPELYIRYKPQNPLVGQEVNLEVITSPNLNDNIVSFLWDIPGYFSGTGNKAFFKPKDSRPIKVSVHAKAKDGGIELGTKEVVITPQGYQVSISQPRYLGPKPKIWKCDTQLGGNCPGLVEVGDTQFSVFNDIYMQAIVSPSSDSLRYRWSIDPVGSCGIPGIGKEIKINCSSTGTYTVKLEVTNAEGVKLGEAVQSINISITQEQINKAGKIKENHDKLQKAQQLAKEGKIDEAVAVAQEAAKLDNNTAKTVLNEIAQIAKIKDGIH